MHHFSATDRILAEAAARFVDVLHSMYAGIRIRPIPSFEDEDFTLEAAIPRDPSLEEVLDACHKECIKVEDDYDLYILPHVVYSQ